MKKCKGCGITLQTKDKQAVGYVVDLQQDYCQRCFRLSHYGDISNFKTNYVTNEKILNIYNKYQNALFVLIIDILDAFILAEDDLLDLFKDKKLLVVINKTDLLPKNITDNKINKIFTKQLFNLNKKYPNIIAAILTNKYEHNFNDQFFNILNELKLNNVVFAGRANAGKSSLINKLLHSDSLTTSVYPGTTLEEVLLTYKNHTFIDTPGLVDINNYSTYMNYEKYNLSKIDKTIKAQVFQLSKPQSYFYDGLLRVDIIPQEQCSISFYINNKNKIHRTKFENGDDFYQRHYPEFVLRVKPLAIFEKSIIDEKLFVLKGLGLFKINGKCFVSIHHLANVKLYESEVTI